MNVRIDNLNREVNLLEIARKGKIGGENAGLDSGKVTRNNFSEELAKVCQLNVSKHAQERLFSRGIALSDSKMTELSQAIDKAAARGSKETLILDDSAAYVVSVPNRTIITAFGRDNLREGVITSIDSAIVL
jgi:flagellar operon protein